MHPVNSSTSTGSEESDLQTIRIENGLLTFVMSTLMNSVEDLVKDSVKKYFTTEEIIEAKRLVFSQCHDKLGAYQDRKGDGRGNRHLNDLFDALRTLDACSVQIIALCSHTELGTLPRIAPSEMDIASLLDRVIRLERLTGGMVDLQATVSSLEGRVEAWMSTQGSYAARAKQPMTNKMEAEKPKVEVQVATKRHQGSKGSSLRVALPENGNEKCRTSTVSPAVATSVCHSDDGFQLQRHQRRKEKRLIRGTAKHVGSK